MLEQYGLPLTPHHVLGEVVTAVLKLLTATIIIDIIAGDIFPANAMDLIGKIFRSFSHESGTDHRLPGHFFALQLVTC